MNTSLPVQSVKLLIMSPVTKIYHIENLNNIPVNYSPYGNGLDTSSLFVFHRGAPLLSQEDSKYITEASRQFAQRLKTSESF